jgi:hypothetical protein
MFVVSGDVRGGRLSTRDRGRPCDDRLGNFAGTTLYIALLTLDVDNISQIGFVVDSIPHSWWTLHYDYGVIASGVPISAP